MRQWQHVSGLVLVLVTTATLAHASDMVCGDLAGLKHPEYSTMRRYCSARMLPHS